MHECMVEESGGCGETLRVIFERRGEGRGDILSLSRWALSQFFCCSLFQAVGLVPNIGLVPKMALIGKLALIPKLALGPPTKL